jgi:L-threonylcarbamoyladenylate synthase
MEVAAFRREWRWDLGGEELGLDELARLSAGILEKGRSVVLPSDTSYALCFSPQRHGWLERLAGAKSRPVEYPVSLFFSGREQAAGYVDAGQEELELMGRLLPGEMTIILAPGPAALGLPGGWPFDGLGVRLVDVPIIVKVCSEAGPVTATSANVHGAPPVLTAAGSVQALSGAGDIELVVDGGTLPGGHSQVVDIRGGRERVIRPSGIPPSV